MMIPLNGRIAIVENQIDEALPLFKVLSQNQLPYIFYKGAEMEYLPRENSRYNDIRLLFLDLNLIDNRKPTVKQVISVLHSVLKKVISTENYPYSIILWSKQENEYADALEELFKTSLQDRAPISIKRFLKSDFFALDGKELDNKLDLLEEINKLLITEPAYSYLLNWENNVHVSADQTLQELFSAYHKYDNWSNNANYIMNKLGESFAGRKYQTLNPKEKLINSYNTLNLVLNDTLGNRTNTLEIHGINNLEGQKSEADTDSIYGINKKLLISEETEPIHYSGSVIQVSGSQNESKFVSFLDPILRKTSKREDILKSMTRIWLNVTPLCDTVMGKIVCHRLVRGIIVSSDIAQPKDFHQNDAVYISPEFLSIDGEETIFLTLDFRHFFTLDTLAKSKNRNPLFRIRQQLLAEIQSKLSRHVNRQGILFLDNR